MHRTSLGLSLILELEQGVDLGELREALHRYASETRYDGSLAKLRKATGDGVDLTVREHREALLVWLRSWGIRGLKIDDAARSHAALQGWWRNWAVEVPGATRVLTDMIDAEITRAAAAYGALAAAAAAGRKRKEGLRTVRFGPTAAAKVLFALRPGAFAPWDDAIRESLGFGGNDAAYRAFLQLLSRALRATANRAGVDVMLLPALLGRQEATPPKLLDEYLWVRITRQAGDPPPRA